MTMDIIEKKKTLAYWLYLPFRFLFKALVVVVLFCYIAMGSTALMILYQTTIYRTQDIDTVSALIANTDSNSNLMAVTTWIHARPLAETDKIIEIITPKSALLEPPTFFELFRRELKLKRPEEALFWLQLGRFRQRYDAMRCNIGVKDTEAFDKLANIAPSPEIEDYLAAHPEALKKALKRVLDFDAKYPAYDDPTTVCRGVSAEKPIDDGTWIGLRAGLRKHTQEFIDSKDKASPL